ncbi:hypothetical protein [Aureibacillus halotolerans]|uniref:hypothetical protein n=1 Tax=Aureibacillus halotolerans TaxID=1508390 RepID=UPI00105D52D0|nr:hypothetical protein [Aureibacillus halotolerans]
MKRKLLYLFGFIVCYLLIAVIFGSFNPNGISLNLDILLIIVAVFCVLWLIESLVTRSKRS